MTRLRTFLASARGFLAMGGAIAAFIALAPGRTPRVETAPAELRATAVVPHVDVDPDTGLRAQAQRVDMPRRASEYVWRSYTKKDGLPSNKVIAVRVDRNRLWIGTDAGLALFENDRFQTYTTADGLSHDVVLSIDVDPLSGDVWAGTMGGLSRWSAGAMEKFNQFNSGLANDVVYSVAVDGPHVWVATAAGASRLDRRADQWSIYNETNAPMHEPWTYTVAVSPDKIYVGAWGGGVLEFNKDTEHWKDYTDPDGEMEVDVFRDDGPVHDITSSLSYADGILWDATYFGLSRYDGVRWRGYFDDESGLVSNFINFVRARGPEVWICTDKGLNSFDGETWRTYTRLDSGRGEVLTTEDQDVVSRETTATAIAHNFVLGVDFDGDTVWIGTEGGLSRGVPVNASSPLSETLPK